jgi:hypothetical protein
MSKKYLVFISSTKDDLKAERLELARIVSELGSVPITLDAFDITREDDRRIIFKSIEECDYFLNLTAHKGGSPELEYSHAVKAGIPVLALIVSEKARWKASRKEKDAAAIKALETFKKKLEGHSHETWINPGDMKQKAVSLLSREMNLNPRQGWVPSTQAVDPSVANELGRLIRENEILKSQIKAEGTGIVQEVQEQIKHALKVLAASRVSLCFYYTDGKNWESPQTFRNLRIFRLLVPELSTAKTAPEISRFLGNILNPDLERIVRKDYPTPSNTIKKIMADFALLKLVKCSGSGDDEAWEMTEYGKEVYTVYRLRQLEKALKDGAQKIAEPA